MTDLKPMREMTWGELESYTWGDLRPYTWGDFRLTLSTVDTEQIVSPTVILVGSTTATVETQQAIKGVMVVSGSSVARTTTEMVVNIVVSDRDYLGNMLVYLPLYERKSDVFKNILYSYDREFRQIEQGINTVDRNIFVDTSVETLAIHERDLGIVTNHKLKYDQRRDQIMARYFSTFEQTTKETILALARAYSDGDVSFTYDENTGSIELVFHSKGIPENIEGLTDALNIIMPCHLSWTYSYSMVKWGELEPFTWGDISHLTWGELSVWKGVDERE